MFKANTTDLIGNRYTKLVVISFDKTIKIGGSWRAYWMCKCDCGSTVSIYRNSLLSGGTKSCGCIERKGIHKCATKIFGQTKEYRTWASIKMRCYNKNNGYYYLYGGRGIVMCDRWMGSFENFIKDVGNAPSDKHSIDRIDNDRGYEPNNCKWSTSKEQSRNTRTNRWIEYNGERMILADWAVKLGLDASALHHKLKRWSISDIANNNASICRKINQYTLDGKFIQTWSSASEASISLGIGLQAISAVLRGKSKTSGKFKWEYHENFVHHEHIKK